jgi:prephenate dehydrogenase
LNVAVLGVGLIGGSIGLAARRRAGAEVCGYDADPQVRERALALGAIDRAAEDIPAAVRSADVVFVATPVGALAQTVRAALEHASPDCVVSDVGSTKRVLADAGSDERFIGGHPLAGAETAGVEHAREDLFEGAVWYLTPARESTAGVLYERLHRLLSAFGAQPTAIDADTHDRLLAAVSHLPHVLANLLAAQAASALGDSELGLVPAVGPSFRDATRVAGANSAIWTDIYMSNRDALVATIDDFARRLEEVRGEDAAGDAAAVTAWNEHARTERERLLGAGVNEGPVSELRASVPNRPGVVAEIALALGSAGVNILDMALSPSQDNRQGVVALWIAGEERSARAEGLIAELGFPVARA